MWGIDHLTRRLPVAAGGSRMSPTNKRSRVVPNSLAVAGEGRPCLNDWPSLCKHWCHILGLANVLVREMHLSAVGKDVGAAGSSITARGRLEETHLDWAYLQL